MYLIITLVFGIGFSGAGMANVYKDPTMPLVDLTGANRDRDTLKVEEQIKGADLRLHSVIVKDGKKIAVINNQMVTVGQVIEGYTLTEIIPYGAKLRDESDKVSLTLLQVNIKKKR
jgi:hypothetical protein